jgi:hypothetical protein
MREARLGLEPVETSHGLAYRRVVELAPPWAMASRAEPGPPGTVYLDTETTGLAGGTGTYVFLVGLGTWFRGRLRVTQYFLTDLAAEPAFLAAVNQAVCDAGRLVTFNGRTFDLPLLETRYLLARAPWWGPTLEHQDLYPLARALWRACVGDCRLGTLEHHLLALDRGPDISGAEVPRLYFHYLRTGDARGLPRVFRHNQWDLVSLAALAARAAGLLAGPDRRYHPAEWLGAARWLERREPARSAVFYESVLGSALPTPLRARAAWRLGHLWRRAGRLSDTVALWRAWGMVASVPLGLLVDLAKLEEHVARDVPAALVLTRRALGRVPHEVGEETRALVLEAIHHRLRRLERRQGAQG